MSQLSLGLGQRWQRLTHEPERGGGRAALEAALLAPILIAALILLCVAAGRVATSGAAVEDAARAAARTASLQRDGDTAQRQATAIARESLRHQGLACATIEVTVDTSQFSRPLGQSAEVRATVTCHLQFADLAGVSPGTTTVTATYVSVIDPYRERQP